MRVTMVSLVSVAFLLVATVEASPGDDPVRMVVMDPLSAHLACDCVEGFAQRRYDLLKDFLEKRMGREILMVQSEALKDGVRKLEASPHFIIGKYHTVRFDADEMDLALTPLALLTDKKGSVDVAGLFVVRADDKARGLRDLRRHRIILGPPWEAEKHGAALATLRALHMALPESPLERPSCNAAALALLDGEGDGAVISSYALALLEGCSTIDRGALRVVGRTSGVPFVTVYATEHATSAERDALTNALGAANRQRSLMERMESLHGFVGLSPEGRSLASPGHGKGAFPWTDWRGEGRQGHADLPKTLPQEARFLWRRPMTGMGLSGIAATLERVIFSDKDEKGTEDIWRCLDADSGEELWQLSYEAAEAMDFSNAPRANPVIHEDRVFLLGAMGHLHCVELTTGRILWRRHLIEEFQSELITWGASATPLFSDGKLIVNPGAEDASLAALDPATGDTLWKTPGEASAYGSFIAGSFGGAKQLIGYDAISLGGWDPTEGRRLWRLTPAIEGDFNVPTPVAMGSRLLLSSENNGTRLHRFDDRGSIDPGLAGFHEALAPDSSTPVVYRNRVYGCWRALFCLDGRRALEEVWRVEGEAFYDYVAIVMGNGRGLIVTVEGELILFKSGGRSFREVSRLRPFGHTEIWSHPAIVGDRLYLRTREEACCLFLK